MGKLGFQGWEIVCKVIALVALVLPFVGVSAHGVNQGDIQIQHPWVREVVMSGMNGAAYMILTNQGAEEDRLVSASVPVAAMTELHQTVERAGVMHMEHLPSGIVLPVGQTVELKPGGLHIMLMNVSRKLEEGEQIPVVLEFEKAGRVETYLAVQPLAGAIDAHH